MKTTANAVKAGQGAQPCATKSRALKAVTAPNPTLLKADPMPGSQTNDITFSTPPRIRGVTGTPRAGMSSSNVARGSTVVASATPPKP